MTERQLKLKQALESRRTLYSQLIGEAQRCDKKVKNSLYGEGNLKKHLRKKAAQLRKEARQLQDEITELAKEIHNPNPNRPKEFKVSSFSELSKCLSTDLALRS